MLENLGVNLAEVNRGYMKQERGAKATAGRRQGRARTATLDRFSTNLTQMAADGKLDPVVGRQKEIRQSFKSSVGGRQSCFDRGAGCQ